MPDSEFRKTAREFNSLVKLPVDANGRGRRQSGGKMTAGVPLAQIFKPRLAEQPDLVVPGRSPSIACGRFRRLCETLEAVTPQAPQTIVVTSASSDEGKSVVAMNLALALASREQEDVLVVDANMRRPTIGHRISPVPRVGLAELLDGQTDLAHVLFELGAARLHVLAAGDPPPDPHELLVSDRLADLLAEMRQRFRRIVIDTPPIVPYVDADLVARFSDGVLIVARAGFTSRGSLMRAISSVTSAPVLGAVLNDVCDDRAD